MNNSCIKCGICCKLIPIINDQILRDGLQEPFDFLIPLSLQEAQNINEGYVQKIQNDFPHAKFRKCKFISDENVCTNPDRPQECINFPSHPMSIVPDCCFYMGEIFLKNEEIKHKIRKYKEEIAYYQTLITPNNKDNPANEKIIKSLQRFVDKYIPYGASDW